MERGVSKFGQNLPMERCKKTFWHVDVVVLECGVKTPEKILTSFMDDPYFGVHLEVERPSGPAERPNQCNALDKLKRCGQ